MMVLPRPWKTFDYEKEFLWWASSNHEFINRFRMGAAWAFALLQECNQNGAYIRIVCYDGRGKTYFTSRAVDKPQKWLFSVPLAEMKSGQHVAFIDGQHYRVTDRYKNNEFLKVLEWIGLGDA